MNPYVLACVGALAAMTGGAMAQQGAPALNDAQRLGQRLYVQHCGLCHNKIQINVPERTGAVEGHFRQWRRCAREDADSRWFAQHARLQADVRAGADRRDRRISEDRQSAAAARHARPALKRHRKETP